MSRRVGSDLAAVIGYHGTTQRTFEAARGIGVPTVLDYPIPPYQVVERLMQEEERLAPDPRPRRDCEVPAPALRGSQPPAGDGGSATEGRAVPLGRYGQAVLEGLEPLLAATAATANH